VRRDRRTTVIARRVISALVGAATVTAALGMGGSVGARTAPPVDDALIASKIVDLEEVRTISKADEARRVTDLYVKRNGAWIRYTYPLGHLETVDSVTLPNGETIDTSVLGGGGGGSRPETQNLKRVFEKCYEYRKIDYFALHCYRAYKPSVRDGYRRWNFRVFFWKGAGNARNGRDLERMALGFVLESDTAAHATAEMTGRYQPDRTHPDDCQPVNLSLGLSYKGVGASVGTTFTQCDTFFGPVPDNYGLKRFIFHWKGEKPGDVVVGMAGGSEFRFRPRKGYAGRRVHNYKADL
jgi:hypothetical protein